MEESGWFHFCLDVLGLGDISGLEPGGYFDAMLTNTSAIYYCALLVSFGALTVAWIATERAAGQRKQEKEKRAKRNNDKVEKKSKVERKNEEVVVKKEEVSPSETRPLSIDKKVVVEDKKSDTLSKFSNIYAGKVDAEESEKKPDTYVLNGHTYRNFEITADDEVTFTPFVSEEEDKAYCEKFLNTNYVPLDQAQPGVQVNAFLDRTNGDIIKNSDDDDDESDIEPTEEELEAAKKFLPEDYRQYLTPKELTVLDDPRESPSRRGTIIERVKKARMRYIRKQLEKGMNSEDHVKEKMAETQCIARVWQIMKDDPCFGGMTLDDIKRQMSMYN